MKVRDGVQTEISYWTMESVALQGILMLLAASFSRHLVLVI